MIFNIRVLAFLGGLAGCALGHAQTGSPSLAGSESLHGTSFATFIENKGQIVDQSGQQQAELRYMAHCPGMKMYLKGNSFSYDLYRITQEDTARRDRTPPDMGGIPDDDPHSIISHRVDVSFPGANPHPMITAESLVSPYINRYGCSMAPDGITHIRRYQTVTYHDVYPSVDIVFHSTDEPRPSITYSLVLHPGADLGSVRLHFDGALGVEPRGSDEIAIKTSLGEITQSIPVSYCIAGNSVRLPLRASMVLQGDEVGFAVNPQFMDGATAPDPTIVWSTYLGGHGQEFGHNVKKDPDGYIYVTGRTTSSDEIATSGAHLNKYQGDWDAYLAKYSTDGKLVWCTYYGGAGFDNFIPLCFVGTDVIASGTTSSITNIATPEASQTGMGGGGRDVLIVRFTSTGTRVWATYYGGSGIDIAYAMEANAKGDIFISGCTGSQDEMTSPGAFQGWYGGSNYDGFLASFDGNGRRRWGTYFGGPGDDEGNSISISRSGDVILVGETAGGAYLVTDGSYQPGYGGSVSDGFLASFSETGKRRWSTFIGGNGVDRLYFVSHDNAGNILLAGLTNSANGVATAGAFQSVYGGGTYDAFLMKMDSSGAIKWGTYYGGPGEDVGYAVAANPLDEILVAGYSSSTTGIASPNGFQTANLGHEDVFLAKFASSGAFVWGSYFGGPGSDICKNLFAAPCRVYLFGNTDSRTGISTPGSQQTVYGGSTDAFLLAVEDGQAPELDITNEGSSIICIGDSVTISASPGFISYKWAPGGQTSRTITVTESGTYWVEAIDPCGNKRESRLVTITTFPRSTFEITPLGPTDLCPGQKVVLDAGSTSPSYTWSTGETTRTITVSEAGEYTVTIVDEFGCLTTSPPVRVTVTPLQTRVKVHGFLTLCPGMSVEFEADSGLASYRWSNGASTRRITVAQPGKYFVTVSNEFGCVANSDTVNVTMVTELSPWITPSKSGVLCPGDSVVLDAGTGYTTYHWSNGETGQRIVVRWPGSYSVGVTAGSGCTGTSAPYTVEFLEPPHIHPEGPLVICQGTSLVLDAGDGYAEYLWSNGATTKTITISASGVYSVKVTSESCTLTSNSVTVTVVTALTPAISASGPTAFCASDSVTLTADSGYHMYRWSNGAVTRSITVKKAGAYAVTVLDPGGCSGTSKTVMITVFSIPTVSLAGGEICDGDSLLLDAGAGYVAYEWSTGESSRSIQVHYAGSYTVRVTDRNGCSGTATASVVMRPPPPLPTITAKDGILMASKGHHYQWYKNGVALPGETNQFLVVKEIGKYSVEVFETENGCKSMSAAMDITLNVERSSRSIGLEVYPDPHEGVFLLRMSTCAFGPIRIQVMDVLGRCVCTKEETSHTPEYRTVIDISSQPAGKYWVRVTHAAGSVVRSVVKR